ISRDGKEFSNIQEGLRYYIIETLKDGNNYSSSELYEKVKTKVPPNWMRNFSQCIYLSHKNNILQRTIDKNYKLKGVGKEMSGKNNNKLNFVCKNGKHFKNIADGNRYYIEEYFNTYGKGRHHEIRNYIKKHVPIKWLKSFDTVFDRYSKDKANNIVKLSRGLYATEQYNNNNVKQLKLKDEDPVPYNYKDRTKDRKSTRLNSSHVSISYAVFCLKKKKTKKKKIKHCDFMRNKEERYRMYLDLL